MQYIGNIRFSNCTWFKMDYTLFFDFVNKYHKKTFFFCSPYNAIYGPF